MNEQQIRALLAAAMAYDNRRPGDANVLAWTEASNRARWTFDEALEALHAHYAENTQFLMPGHITERIRITRRQNLDLYQALPPAAPATKDARTEAIRSYANRFNPDRRRDDTAS